MLNLVKQKITSNDGVSLSNINKQSVQKWKERGIPNCTTHIPNQTYTMSVYYSEFLKENVPILNSEFM